jgi:bifunctional NMN adenylyltransferase/nudix hydrolase
MSKEHKTSVMIGWFQPLHNTHLEVIKHSLEISDRLIIVMCGHKKASTIKDPWSSEQRVSMMLQPALESVSDRVTIVSVRDHLYNDSKWIAKVQGVVGGSDDVCVTRCPKSRETSFPNWKHDRSVKTDVYTSDVRKRYFTYDSSFASLVPKHVHDFMQSFSYTDDFKRLHDEYHFLSEHNRSWYGAPTAPTFVTSHAVVTRSGHVLVKKRAVTPGVGCYSLPGAVVKNDERTLDTAMRSVSQSISPNANEQLHRNISCKVFDHPERSMMGREITHAFHFNTGVGKLFDVKNEDTMWISFNDVFSNEQLFFDDHFHIITHFLDRFEA